MRTIQYYWYIWVWSVDQYKFVSRHVIERVRQRKVIRTPWAPALLQGSQSWHPLCPPLTFSQETRLSTWLISCDSTWSPRWGGDEILCRAERQNWQGAGRSYCGWIRLIYYLPGFNSNFIPKSSREMAHSGRCIQVLGNNKESLRWSFSFPVK